MEGPASVPPWGSREVERLPRQQGLGGWEREGDVVHEAGKPGGEAGSRLIVESRRSSENLRPSGCSSAECHEHAGTLPEGAGQELPVKELPVVRGP